MKRRYLKFACRVGLTMSPTFQIFFNIQHTGGVCMRSESDLDVSGGLDGSCFNELVEIK